MSSPSAIARFLTALYGDAPADSFVEVRYRRGEGMRQDFVVASGLTALERIITARSTSSDVYVGVVPRRRRGGGRADLVASAPVLWLDCDTPDSVDAVQSFTPAPSLSVRSGSGDNLHAYWLLTEPAALSDIEAANRRLAFATGADLACTDAARIMRPVSALNWKRTPPVEVRLVLWNGQARHNISGVLARVPELPAPPGRPSGAGRHRVGTSTDPLLDLEPATFVEVLAGVRVPRSGKIACPFHDDRTPSLQVYRHSARGWYCYGCRRGGSIYDFAGALWGLSTRGHDFLELRERLSDALLSCDTA